jgi:hypothetical protein
MWAQPNQVNVRNGKPCDVGIGRAVSLRAALTFMAAVV